MNSNRKTSKLETKKQTAEFKDGQMVSFKGVVPLVPDKLKWDFLKKDADK